MALRENHEGEEVPPLGTFEKAYSDSAHEKASYASAFMALRVLILTSAALTIPFLYV